jgi:predicted nuclease of predicted toxin-antitoxin system
MTFFLDQDVPDAIARVVEQSGHRAIRLREVLPMDSPDLTVLEAARKLEAVLITCNRDDFLALAAANSHAGIVILIRRPSRPAECAHFLRLLQSAGESGLKHNINFA